MFFSLEVENFRSIKDRQVLSFRRAGSGAESRLELGDNAAGDALTPVLVLFGANASGKSNVLDALGYIQMLVLESADQKVGEPLPVQTFRFDERLRSGATSFLLHFATKSNEYEYSFDLQGGFVVSERLDEFVQNEFKRSRRMMFSRTRKGESTVIKVSPRLRGAKKAIIDATRDNMLFLSKAAKENFGSLMDAYQWFTPPFEDSVELFDTDPEFRKWVLRLLENADLGVSGIEIKPPADRPPQELVKMLAEGDDPDSLAEAEHRLLERNRRPMLAHRAVADGESAEIEIPWDYESLGTKQLWRYAGAVYTALRDGKLLMLDEITGLHPLLLKEIISIFQRRSTNPHGAQLLFSSHDVVLLGNWGGLGFLLDRDQIWFTEKGNDGATQLYSVADFSAREVPNIEKFYLQGRLGATPILGDLVRESAGREQPGEER